MNTDMVRQSDQKPPHLLILPLEVRYMIFDQLVTRTPRVILWESMGLFWLKCTGLAPLAQTCQQLQDEVQAYQTKYVLDDLKLTIFCAFPGFSPRDLRRITRFVCDITEFVEKHGKSALFQCLKHVEQGEPSSGQN